MTRQPRPRSGRTIPTLEVSGLTTHIAQRGGAVTAVDDVSFAVMPGEILGVVGESGSGKSMLAYSIMGLVDPPVEVVAGSIKLNGQELRGMPEKDMRRLRGDRIAMIFQDPMMTLNPVLRIDTQRWKPCWRIVPSAGARPATWRTMHCRGSASSRRRSGCWPIRINFLAACGNALRLPSHCSMRRT
jgi:ABC-type microcin C transport system duplicated ATPase subunit YejF